MARTYYTAEQRTEALKLYAEAGPAEASRRTGIKRATISKWASRNGVSSDRADRTRKATEAARQSYAEGRARRSAALAGEADALIDRLREANPQRCLRIPLGEAGFGVSWGYLPTICPTVPPHRRDGFASTGPLYHPATGHGDLAVLRRSPMR
jgi:hypothetical protein